MERRDRPKDPSCHFVPPVNKQEVRLKQVEDTLRECLRQFITGRGKKDRLEEAVKSSVLALRPMLKLPSDARLGATVMTEGASKKNEKLGRHTKGPNIL